MNDSYGGFAAHAIYGGQGDTFAPTRQQHSVDCAVLAGQKLIRRIIGVNKYNWWTAHDPHRSFRDCCDGSSLLSVVGSAGKRSEVAPPCQCKFAKLSMITLNVQNI